MSQTKDQIESHLDQARSELSSNLSELERRAASAMDWKQHFERNPANLLGVAFAGGFALSLLIGGGRRKRRHNGDSSYPQYSGIANDSGLWNNVKGALIGLAATRLTDYVDRIFPSPAKPVNHIPEQPAFNGMTYAQKKERGLSVSPSSL